MEQAWELFRRGQLDQERHHRLVRDAVRRNLADLVTHGTITGGGRVKIPVKALRQWRFEFDPNRHEQTGTFGPDPLGVGGASQQGRRPRKGDTVGVRPREGRGNGGEPGGESGNEGFYEVEIGVEAVAEALFSNLELPRLQHKQQSEQSKEEWQMTDVRRRGSWSNLDKRRTAVENIRRNAAAGLPGYANLAEDDLRFRVADLRHVPQDQVAVLFVRDCSGSMGEQEKYLSRTLAFWITRFLQFKYKKMAETAFILFHTEASEVSEEEFFHRSEGGGTLVSSGFRLAADIIAERFSPERYNLYLFLFSDGENASADNAQVSQLVRKLMAACNLIGYADIRPGQATQTYRSEWSAVAEELQGLQAPHIITVNVQQQEDVLAALQHFFRKD